MNWRRSEWLSFATLLTVGGWIWYVSAKNSLLVQNDQEIKEMRPRVDAIERKEDEFEARNTAQMTLIIRELDGIHREIKREAR
jgi:hypothetical protein